MSDVITHVIDDKEEKNKLPRVDGLRPTLTSEPRSHYILLFPFFSLYLLALRSVFLAVFLPDLSCLGLSG